LLLHQQNQQIEEGSAPKKEHIPGTGNDETWNSLILQWDKTRTPVSGPFSEKLLK
jgi:hypothetical protein